MKMKTLLNYNNFIVKINENVSLVDKNDLIKIIDYTLLKPESTEDEIVELCNKADKLSVKSVCVLPKMVKVASRELLNSDVLVCTVISFPNGTNTTEEKQKEIRQAIDDGADECDVVLNYPLLKTISNSGENDTDVIEILTLDVQTLVDECHKYANKQNEGVVLKVIVESGLLTEEETKIATKICIDAGSDYIKTSTGMVPTGAELNKVKIMKKTIDKEVSDMKIKVSGGIRTISDLEKYSPYVDRFGVGFLSVDNMFGEIEGVKYDNVNNY